MNTQKINLSINRNLLNEIKKWVNARKRSEFINQAVFEKLERLKKEKLDKELEEGYRLRSKEATDITKSFESADLESLDEY